MDRKNKNKDKDKESSFQNYIKRSHNYFEGSDKAFIYNQEKEEKSISFDTEKLDSSRPTSLDEFKGQKELKKNLSIFIQASQQRKEALDHVFVSGPPGLGKTTLANLIASELGVDFKPTSAPALEKPKDLVGLLSSIDSGTIFFIDEIHRLKPQIEEMLYIAMEEFKLDWVIGQGPSARTVRLPIAPFTLVGATTKPEKVASPLVTRFGIQLSIPYYSETELLEIIQRSCAILGMGIDQKAAQMLAGCCRGTPRIANRLIRRMRDFSQVQGKNQISLDVVQQGLLRLQIDEQGLQAKDKEILQAIAEKFSGGPVGLETLAICVGESADSLEDFYEPYLIQKGYLQRTARGRMLTELGYQLLGVTPKSKQNAQESFF